MTVPIVDTDAMTRRGLARAAAWDAGRAAARELGATVAELQGSAVELLDRMIALTEDR